MKQEFKIIVDVKQYEDESTEIVGVENCVNNALHNYFRSMEQDGDIEGYTLAVEEVEEDKKCYSCDGKGVGLDWGAMNFWECDVCKGTGELEGE
jgi:Zn finger protein HypA/HybF involved in hydrogenase expression